MVVLSQGGTLTIDDIPSDILSAGAQPIPAAPSYAVVPAAQPYAVAPPVPPPAAAAEAPEQPHSLAASEKDIILSAIARCRNNKTKAAETLGISRRTLHRKLNEWGLG
jgi:DNA-binding NtrC family response regulator